MKKLLLLVTLLSLLSCENVRRLHHGVKYNTCSSTLTLDDLKVVYGKWNSCGGCCDIVNFPATPIVKTFTHDETEDSPVNEEFNIPLGTSVVSFDYSIEFQILTSEDAKKCFMACKVDKDAEKDFDSYINVNLKNSMREVFKNVMSKYKTPEQLLDSTQLFENRVFLDLQQILIEDGLTVTRANIINRFRFPKSTQDMLDAIQVTKTRTMKAEADAKATELESKANLIATKNNSEADVAQALAEQKIALIKAETEAATIVKINKALTPNYLKLKEIENFVYKTQILTPQGIVEISSKQ